MRCRHLGWAETGPTLRLDYRRFAYAGKFVMSTTGKAVVVEDGTDPTADECRPLDADKDADADADADENPPVPTTEDGYADLLAAAAFNEDRTDPATLWIRYVTVRRDRRGEGIGPRLCQFVVDAAERRGYDRVRIAVNNPYAYEALYRAGFGFTGRETGLAELVLERPDDRSPEAYQRGLDRFRARDLTSEVRTFLDARTDATPPSVDSGG